MGSLVFFAALYAIVFWVVSFFSGVVNFVCRRKVVQKSASAFVALAIYTYGLIALGMS